MTNAEHWRRVAGLLRAEPAEVIARTMWGEARNQGPEGMAYVAHVILNRTKFPSIWSDDPRDVCLQPFQFSCMLREDPNFRQLSAVTTLDPIYQWCLRTADELLSQGDARVDPTRGATHYHAVKFTEKPPWVDKLLAQGFEPQVLGGHVFYGRPA